MWPPKPCPNRRQGNPGATKCSREGNVTASGGAIFRLLPLCPVLGTPIGKKSPHREIAVVQELQSQAGFESGVVLQGTYQILHLLGTGGMGRVYAAAHARLPGLFAVKALHREFLKNENAVQRFRGEAEIMAGLRHPNIVQVFDFNVAEDGTPYLVMEFIEGSNLGERLRAGERLSPARVARVVSQIASALDAAHRHGIVHRDLKPENVMLTCPDGQEDFVKVVDFGISKAVGSNRITAETTILGTPQFMAPEQAQGRHDEVDHRTDQFALAAMTYTLLSGCEPFPGTSPVTVLYQVVHEDPKPIARHLDWRCKRVDAVLRRAMSKNIAERFTSILEFSTALEAAIEQDLRNSAAHRSAPAVESFVRASQTGKDTIEVPDPTYETTLIIDRPERRMPRPAHAAAAGIAAAALLAASELWASPWQLLRSVFTPAKPAAANVAQPDPGAADHAP
jgi:serine/threonine protein kinase